MEETGAGAELLKDSMITTPELIPASAIPAAIKYNGKVREAWKWTDKLGEHILITSVVEPYDDKEKNEYGEEGQTAELYATVFVKKGNVYEEIWSIQDKEKACPFDITCDFIPHSTSITDLDKNGLAEIKLQYRVVCRSDVSPATMKLIMWENQKTYRLSGLSWVSIGPESKFDVTAENVNLEKAPKLKDEMEAWLQKFGKYENEQSFASAPAEFLNYARTEWLKYIKESFSE